MNEDNNSLYKYAGPGDLSKVFSSTDHVTLKCGLPKDFNDPYELFLTINFEQQRPDVLAFYADVIGDLPQLPTTCFSRSPIVIPMWAHYAMSSQGFVIEFNEELLAANFSKNGFGNVNYKDVANDDILETLNRAHVIMKPRYFYMLRQSVFHTAYFTKTTCWSYEEERRMVVNPNETRVVNDLILLDVPIKCVSAIISGARASPETQNFLREKATKLGCPYYTLKIGKTSPTPFLQNDSGESFSFIQSKIEKCSSACSACKEPVRSQEKQCSWCQIDESLQQDAADRNTYRKLDQLGLLADYIKGMDEITDNIRKK